MRGKMQMRISYQRGEIYLNPWAGLLCLVLLLVEMATFAQPAAKIGVLDLRPLPQPINNRHFHISQLSDERSNRGAIAYLFAPETPERPVAVDLRGGGLAGIQGFMKKSLSSQKEGHPVLFRLKMCRINESQVNSAQVKGDISLALSFDLLKNGKTSHLTDYKVVSHYTRHPAQLPVVELALRQSLENALKFFNSWMSRQVEINLVLARGVEVHFSDYQGSNESDSVFYSPNRPLIWSDFQDKPRGSRYAAYVFPDFAYDHHARMINGIIHLQLKLKVYMLKSASWTSTHSLYDLNHEQRHFDIVKLVAERFKRKIRAEQLSAENYEGILNVEFLESYREMNRLQKQYDEETRHGIDSLEQERWNQYIDQELKQAG